MAEQILDYKASEPSSISGSDSIFVPQSPANFQIADLGLFLTPPVPSPNHVRLIANLGIQNISIGVVQQVVFRIFRDENEIFRTQQGLDFTGVGGDEQFYTVSLQALDFNVPSGFHVYTLTVERLTATVGDVVIGPITFSGLAIGPID